MTKKYSSYLRIYEQATSNVLELAKHIDSFAYDKFKPAYRLYDITYTLRELYKDRSFREKFTGIDPDEYKWSCGMCALETICIKDLYIGLDFWDIYAIKPGVWEKGPVIFLREKINGTSFGTVGEYFFERVPYELGTSLQKDLKTPNIKDFVNIVKSRL